LAKTAGSPALETLRTKWVFDQTGRFQPRIRGKQRDAAGVRHRDHGHWPGSPGSISSSQKTAWRFLDRGLIAVNPQTLMTSAEGIFRRRRLRLRPTPHHDSVRRRQTRRSGIDEFLRGVRHPEPTVEVEILKRHKHARSGFLDLIRQPIPRVPLDRRTGMTEVELGSRRKKPRKLEARRCLHCLGSHRLPKEIS